MASKISIDTIQAAAAALRELPKAAPPQPRELGKMQALQALRIEVRALRGRGYGWEEIANQLARLGIQVSASAVKKSQSGPTRKPNTNRPIIESNNSGNTHQEGKDQDQFATNQAAQSACAASTLVKIENTKGGEYVGN